MDILFDRIINILGTVGVFVLVISVLVFVHEMGHYLFARRYGVRVEAFSVGFGPELGGFTDRHGTRWLLCAIPLGGYVKLKGMEDEGNVELPNAGSPSPSSIPPHVSARHKTDRATTIAQVAQVESALPSHTPDTANSFAYKPLWQRAVIIAGGPLFNYIFALILITLVFRVEGMSIPSNYLDAGIGGVSEGSPAEMAGLMSRDVIVSINDTTVVNFEDIIKTMRNSNGEPLTVAFLRDGARQIVSITPVPRDAPPGGYYLGVLGPQPTLQSLNIPQSAWYALLEIHRLNMAILGAIGGMFSNSSGLSSIGGPIEIARTSYKFAQNGVIPLLVLTATLSINLGLINLFPIPVLDGGRLMIYGVEAFMRRPINAKIRKITAGVGVGILFFIFGLAMFNDISGLIRS